MLSVLFKPYGNRYGLLEQYAGQIAKGIVSRLNTEPVHPNYYTAYMNLLCRGGIGKQEYYSLFADKVMKAAGNQFSPAIIDQIALVVKAGIKNKAIFSEYIGYIERFYFPMADLLSKYMPPKQYNNNRELQNDMLSTFRVWLSD